MCTFPQKEKGRNIFLKGKQKENKGMKNEKRKNKGKQRKTWKEKENENDKTMKNRQELKKEGSNGFPRETAQNFFYMRALKGKRETIEAKKRF